MTMARGGGGAVGHLADYIKYLKFVLMMLVAVAVATPYYPQTRQLYYPGLPQPQYSPYPLVGAPLPLPYRQLFYPQPSTNFIAPAPFLRYPANTLPLAAPAKQAFYYPNPYTGNTGYVLAGNDESSGGFWQTISNFIYPSAQAEAEKPAAAQPAEAGAAANAESEDKPAESETPTKVKEEEAEKPTEDTKAKLKDSPQNYVLVGQPQFYGNYGLQRLNPTAVLPTADHGAVSSYLLLKNFPAVKFAPFPQPSFPSQAAPQPASDPDAELVPTGGPGSAALGYQKLLQAAQAGRQQKEYEDAVSVDAVQRDSTPQEDKPDSETESESEKEKESDDDETGPTIAQAKPKAIALAGPGGVAAAAPVGTALVGPGGMALSAPEATAVAGVKNGAAGGAISPATTKHATKAVRTYQLAQHNLNFLLGL